MRTLNSVVIDTNILDARTINDEVQLQTADVLPSGIQANKLLNYIGIFLSSSMKPQLILQLLENMPTRQRILEYTDSALEFS
jgi:hypothetical protein